MSVHLELPGEFIEQVAELVAELLDERQQAADDGWLDVPEAADFLKVSRSELYSKCSRRGAAFPVHKEGSRSYFRPAELTAWRLANSNTNGGSPP
jgi:hypothetical protein